ncbi:hypothetical protein AK812_SmicGene7992 [Symbiodinium microadriaticum]|uniref:Uncharacterized protein n=1 Tax=Symbiodinium microadriaticum TaxID=2951 RepID=A0A1Q9EM37_SYMMI|nr:hypothetical protein AK812_SmicGene7992 [Symbiodinium microadriaticum]
MGERAAARTNKMLNKISGLYVSKTIGYSKDYADSFQRVFGKAKSADGDKRGQIENLRSVDFETGPLGLEIEWSAPPATWLRQVQWLPGGCGCSWRLRL